jgi:putative redox protein
MPMMVVKHEGGMASSMNVRGHQVMTDVPPAMGGEDRGPTPVDLLAGSLGTCIAFYVARWCQQAGVPHEGFEVDLDYVHDREAHCVPEMKVSLRMPASFPENRREAVLKVAKSCTVHNTLCSLPQIEVAVAPHA